MLTVVQGDGPADAKAGLIEALLALAVPGEDCFVLHGVAVVIGFEWPRELPADASLHSPFDALAREASTRRTAAHASASGRTWACLDLRDEMVAITVATVAGDVLSSIDELWQQTLMLCRSLSSSAHPIRRAAVTMHFQRMRLSDSHRQEALHLVRAWESARTP